MALFAGLASAQVPNPVAMNQIPCTVNAATSPTVRAEGVAEKVGDLVLTCFSSTITGVSGNIADRATVVVNYGVPVTSHADAAKVTVGTTDYYPSEAILTIDEPNTVAAASAAVVGYGQNQAITLCTFANSIPANYAANCPAFLQLQNAANYYTMANAAAGFAPTQNVYQGAQQLAANNGKVTFLNVPILPNGPNANHVYRITNVRVTPGSGAITPTVTVTANTGAINGLVLSNNSATVATPATSMTTSLNAVGGISLCMSPIGGGALNGNSKLALATFTEAYNNAWKTQTLPIANAAGAAENAAPATQIVANGTYTYGSALLSETGLYSPTTAGGVAIGVADYGTRFKLVFSGLPQLPAAGQPGTQFWISTTNVTDLQNGLSAPANIGGQTQGAYAIMVGQSGGTPAGGDLTAVERTAWGVIPAPVVGATYTNPANATVINFTQINPATASVAGGVQKGQAEVVYELTNITKSALNSLKFAIYVSYTNGLAAPATGNTATVQLGYAPFDNSTTLVPATFAPRFTAPTSTASPFFNVLPCQTSLLFPYVVANSGYATGVAVSNTSADPYTTSNSTGTCSLAFYSSTTAATYTTPAVAPGTTYSAYLANTNQLFDAGTGGTLTNFAGQGYMFATCNFKYAHGFAFITKNDGANSAMAMGYVASVISGSDRGVALTGEALEN